MKRKHKLEINNLLKNLTLNTTSQELQVADPTESNRHDSESLTKSLAPPPVDVCMNGYKQTKQLTKLPQTPKSTGTTATQLPTVPV